MDNLHDRIARVMGLLDLPRQAAEKTAHAWLDLFGAQ